MNWRKRREIEANRGKRKINVTFEVEGKEYHYEFFASKVFKKSVSQEVRSQIKKVCDTFICDMNEHDNAPT